VYHFLQDGKGDLGRGKKRGKRKYAEGEKETGKEKGKKDHGKFPHYAKAFTDSSAQAEEQGSKKRKKQKIAAKKYRQQAPSWKVASFPVRAKKEGKGDL